MQTVTDNIYILVLTGMLGASLLVVSFILLQIRNQNKLLGERKKLHDTEIQYQQQLLHTLITSQEIERERIGMNLHDEVGSTLSSLRLIIEDHNSKLTEPAGDFVVNSKTIIDNIITNVRTICHNLAPRIRDSLSLYDAVHDLTNHINLSGKLYMTFNAAEHNINVQISSNVAIALYRVIAELVNNTLKHAHAKQIQLSMLVNNSTLHIHYSDDGTGLPAGNATPAKGMGMQNIESRLNMTGAGYKLLNNTKGFAMEIDMPLKHNHESYSDSARR